MVSNGLGRWGSSSIIYCFEGNSEGWGSKLDKLLPRNMGYHWLVRRRVSASEGNESSQPPWQALLFLVKFFLEFLSCLEKPNIIKWTRLWFKSRLQPWLAMAGHGHTLWFFGAFFGEHFFFSSPVLCTRVSSPVLYKSAVNWCQTSALTVPCKGLRRHRGSHRGKVVLAGINRVLRC